MGQPNNQAIVGVLNSVPKKACVVLKSAYIESQGRGLSAGPQQRQHCKVLFSSVSAKGYPCCDQATQAERYVTTLSRCAATEVQSRSGNKIIISHWKLQQQHSAMHCNLPKISDGLPAWAVLCVSHPNLSNMILCISTGACNGPASSAA